MTTSRSPSRKPSTPRAAPRAGAIAGMVCRDFPDNSVVCHARRLAGFPQDNFVSGSVLGVNCDDLPFPFFPDIYNEDWFFFSKAVARLELANVGDAAQRPYKPFADPERARHEEFGDLLAEGLFSLIGEVLDRPVDEEEDDESIDYRELFEFVHGRILGGVHPGAALQRCAEPRHGLEALLHRRGTTSAAVVVGGRAATEHDHARTVRGFPRRLAGRPRRLGNRRRVDQQRQQHLGSHERAGASEVALAESGDTQVAKPQRGAARRSYAAAERRAQALNCAS